jgi:DNA-binding response OmpR family regulator
MAKILLVEDDRELVEIISDWLTGEMHSVEHVNNGLDALERLKFYPYDLIVLDLGLPRLGGVEVCKQFRASGGKLPVLMLTGKTELEQKEEGLDAGGDDYLCKPFHPRELSARIRALLRRPGTALPSTLKVGNIELHPGSLKVTKNGKELVLLPREYALLEFFMRNPGCVFNSEALLDRVWSNESDCSPDTVKVHINRLRNKIDDDGSQSMIRTVFRQGYKLEPAAGDKSLAE